MFWKAWKPEPAGDAGGRDPAEEVAGLGGDRERAPDDDGQQQDQDARADQAELLAGDGEDEVGVLLGDEAGPGLRALEQSLAEQAAVADRDARLLDVVAGAARVERRVDEGEEAVDLVGLEHAHRHRRDGADDRAEAQPAEPARPAPATARTPKTVADEDQHRAEVGLQQDQHGGDAGDGEHRRPPRGCRRCGPSGARCARPRRGPCR